MERRLILLCLAVSVAVCMVCEAQSGDRENGVTFHVSLLGCDTNAGSQERPFATIQRAQQAVRERLAGGQATDITVSIHGGVYYLPDGLIFTPADSGTESSRVTYAAYPAEQVTDRGLAWIDRQRGYRVRLVRPRPSLTRSCQAQP